MRRTLLIGGAAAIVAGALTVPATAADTAVVGPAQLATSTLTATGETTGSLDATVSPDARSPEAQSPDAAGAAIEAQHAAAVQAQRQARRDARQRARERERRERRAAERRAARAARDMVGVQPSLYRGRYYVPRHDDIRRCIVRRESMGQYRVVNRSSGAAGAYQFLLSTSNYVARQMKRPDLVGVPASRWNRLEQDQAFWTLWDHGRGRGHWAGGRWSC